MSKIYIGMLCCLALIISPLAIYGNQASAEIQILWKNGNLSGSLEATYGVVKSVRVKKGKSVVKDVNFFSSTPNALTLTVSVDDVVLHPGPEATIIHVKTVDKAFSFFLRDVNSDNPIYIPQYDVIITTGSDHRSYQELVEDILSKELKTKIQAIEDVEETFFESIEHSAKNMSVPTWLGISRDFRLFEITEVIPDLGHIEANVITPRFSRRDVKIPEIMEGPIQYMYSLGRGIGPINNIVRRLENGVLPILHSVQQDDDIEYHAISFASLEKSPLSLDSPIGTDFLVADSYTSGMFTPSQLDSIEAREEKELNPSEEVVLYFRTIITNKGHVPRYAWFKTLRPGFYWHSESNYSFDPNTGFSLSPSGSVFCVSKLNGKPLYNEEVSILLQPGEQAVLEFYLPHRPVSIDRAASLQNQSFQARYEESKEFWLGKLAQASTIKLPEKRIEEMLKAGLLHLDLITYGKEPNATLAPTIGFYSPIGTESSPIIQFYASMGLQDLAKRSLMYFLDKQHDNGFMQNFGGYMVETGATLWCIGEYIRYTQDFKWAKQIEEKILKSCNYLIEWRNENKLEELRGRGYGMINGKVADPEHQYRQFMLNGYAYLGLSRIAELLRDINPVEASRIESEAQQWKSDIRETFFNLMALSPVVPLGDGTWSSTAPPWAEITGPKALYLEKDLFWSHGSFTGPDAILGPMYLVFCEVLSTDEDASKMLLNYISELFFQGNSAFSQPYYSRHNWVQAKLGMVKPFLNTYYTTMAAHADRQTYTFWEHMYKASVHKTHEEAWFLMETRWMLYMEDENTLNLFKTIPRAWMADGEEILLDGVWSYFGPLRITSKSNVNTGYIEATVESIEERKPDTVRIRLPHPDYKKPVRVFGGTYDEKTETVIVANFSGQANVRLEFKND